MPGKTRELVAVTIPIYKEIPDEDELISLRQTLKILHRYSIIFVAPESLDTGFYEQQCANTTSFIVKRFKNEYFDGIKGYNKLMLSKEFYKEFIGYKYILVCQLDAYVFRDELADWCKKGYDFIGAPYTFVDMDNYPIRVLTKYRALLKSVKRVFPWSYTFKQVGNGGLSLRNVKKTLFLLNFKKFQPKLWEVLMEDNFFQYWGNILFPFFKLPDVTEAARFSIELDPERTFESIGKKLPFGCHAYRRYEPEFWKKHIEFADLKLSE